MGLGDVDGIRVPLEGDVGGGQCGLGLRVRVRRGCWGHVQVISTGDGGAVRWDGPVLFLVSGGSRPVRVPIACSRQVVLGPAAGLVHWVARLYGCRLTGARSLLSREF